MTTLRVTQSLVEVLRKGDPSLRTTQNLVEVLRGGDPDLRVTQSLVEVLRDSGFTTTTTTTVTTTTGPPPTIRATQIPILLVERPLQPHVFETQQALLVGEYHTTTTTTSTTTSTTVEGSVCWGQDSGVEEDYIRNFTDWEGTATREGSGDAEVLKFNSGQYKQLITPWKVDGKVRIRTNKYGTGDNVSIFYKTDSSISATQTKSWSNYVNPFYSLGYVDVRLRFGSTTTSSTVTSTSTVTTSTVTVTTSSSTTTTSTTVTSTTAPPEFLLSLEDGFIISEEENFIIEE